MYTRSALGLYRISIVNLPFPVKHVDGYGDYNISFDSEKDFDFFLLVVSAQARLVKVKDFVLPKRPYFAGIGRPLLMTSMISSELAPLSAARSRV
jgi:hypothetical protein